MKQSKLLRYGIIVCLVALLCVFTSPVVAKHPTEQVITRSSLAISPQEEQAKILYSQGRFTQAAELLQSVLQSYQSSGDKIGQAVVLSNLALNWQQLGRIPQANEAITKAIAILQTIPDSPQRLAVLCQIFDVQGSLQLTQGKAEEALSAWEQAASLYQKLGDTNKAILMQIHQAQALQTLGLYRRAISTLQNLKTTLQNQPDSLTKAMNFRSLGDAFLVAGDLKQAEPNLQAGLKIAQQLNSPEAIAATYLSLGNLARTTGNLKTTQKQLETAKKTASLDFYQQAYLVSTNTLTKTQAQLNRLRLLIEQEQWSQAQVLYPQVQSQIPNLPLGRAAIYAQVNFAQSLLQLHQKIREPNLQTIAQILATARQQAKQLQDIRAESFVLGNLGHIYELTQQWSIAQDLTTQALNLSQLIQAQDIAYRWQWQLGRIFCQNQPQCEQKGDSKEAIVAYTQAFNTLQSIRSDLIATNADMQYSFRESVEPVYRGLVDLLLQAPIPTQENLKQARQVLEALQVAKLQNFLQQACQDTKLQLDEVIDAKDQTAAVIYSIVLDDRLEVILKLPNQLLYHAATKLAKQEIEDILTRLHSHLQEIGSYEEVQQEAQQVYSWLLQPIQQQLEQNQIKTLIFVLDGPLRKIPMATLYDGQKYLVEKYAVSLVLGLQVRDPLPLRRTEMNVLAASLTEPPQNLSGFSRLENVQLEVQEIKKTGVKVNWIAEQQFTNKAFNKALNNTKVDIVHLATHGQFGADRENTFVLTADGTLKIDDFDQLFYDQKLNRSQGIELLFLSACQTATGNDQEVMGIAGTTVQAGANSAIASLWDLDDASSVIFTREFYLHLGQPNVSRAEALRLAQQALLQNPEYDHPRYWAPYVLVGSWL